MAYAELGVAVAEMSGDTSMLDDALEKMVKASERILDPAMTKDIERYERQRRKLGQVS
jgi:hypothetical protein